MRRSDEDRYSALYRIAMSIAGSADLIPMLDKSLHSFNRNLGLAGSAVLFYRAEGGRVVSLERIHSVTQGDVESGMIREALRRADSICGSLDIPGIEKILPLREKLEGDINVYAYSLPYSGMLMFLKKGHPFPALIDAEIVQLAEKLSYACGVCLRRNTDDYNSGNDALLNGELVEAGESLVRMVDDMRHTQEELHAGKNHLALILQSLGEGVIVVDGDDNVLLSNIKALEYFDVMPPSGSVFKMNDLLANSCDGERMIKGLRNEEGAAEQTVEFEVCGRHGAKRYLRVTANSLESLLAGLPETIYLVQDITREKDIDRMKNEFISNLSHELRTPMNAILGISRMIAEKNAENLSDRQRQGLSIVYESGRRLLALINDILDLSKIEAGKMDIVIRPVDTRDFVSRIEKMAEPLASENVSFRIDVSPGVPEVFYADEDRVQQVVINLVGNSFKFTSEGTVVLSVERKGDRIFVSVSDTGIGIPGENLPFIFDRFRQGDGSMSRKYQGSGIGLSLSRELVMLMGGTIKAESAYGKGTVVSFDFPIGDPEKIDRGNARTGFEPRPKRCEAGGVGLKSKTILIAEDEEAGRETLRFLLSDRFHLVFAGNGFEAVEEFDKNRIDLILMDIMMPGKGGYETFDEIRGTGKGVTVPIIAVTARAMPGEKEKILGYGFDGYVSKPIDCELLIETIDDALKSRMNGGCNE